MSQSKRISLIHFAHACLEKALATGDTVIDATVGNGHDTCFLAEVAGSSGRVYGFDIQESAIETTRELLERSACTSWVELISAGHETMSAHIPITLHGSISAVMFNLGYLPGSDKQVITCAETTLKALTMALTLLRKGGVLSVMVYPGHPGGMEEAQEVRRWADQMEGQGHTVMMERTTANPSAPELWLITKE